MKRSFAVCTALVVALTLAACGGAPEDSATENDSAELSSKGTFTMFQGEDGKFYFDLVSTNHQVVLRSQGYAQAGSVNTGISAVITQGKLAANYTLFVGKDGQHYFNLHAGNNRVVAASEGYASASNAERGAATARAILHRM